MPILTSAIDDSEPVVSRVTPECVRQVVGERDRGRVAAHLDPANQLAHVQIPKADCTIVIPGQCPSSVCREPYTDYWFGVTIQSPSCSGHIVRLVLPLDLYRRNFQSILFASSMDGKGYLPAARRPHSPTADGAEMDADLLGRPYRIEPNVRLRCGEWIERTLPAVA